MKTEMLTSLLPESTSAVNTFLETILGEAVNLQIDGPQLVPLTNLLSIEAPYYVLIASTEGGEGNEDSFGVFVESNWLPFLSQAMIGEEMTELDAAGEDLLRELAAQCYGAIRSRLTTAGQHLPEYAFQIHTTIQDVSPEALTAQLYQLPFSLEKNDQLLTGFVVVPAPADAKEAAPSRTASRARKLAESQEEPISSIRQKGPTQPVDPGSVNISPAVFPEFKREPVGLGDGLERSNFELLVDVELEITVELGRTKMLLADVLRLTTGSVIELDKLAGEPLEVYANGRLIAEGEAVVIDEQFGIRISRLMTSRAQARNFA